MTLQASFAPHTDDWSYSAAKLVRDVEEKALITAALQREYALGSRSDIPLAERLNRNAELQALLKDRTNSATSVSALKEESVST